MTPSWLLDPLLLRENEACFWLKVHRCRDRGYSRPGHEAVRIGRGAAEDPLHAVAATSPHRASRSPSCTDCSLKGLLSAHFLSCQAKSVLHHNDGLELVQAQGSISPDRGVTCEM